MKAADWTGLKFGRLTFTKPAGRDKQKKIIWEAQCECGNTHILVPIRAKRGDIQSCGCFLREKLRGNTHAVDGRKTEPRLSTAKSVWLDRYNDSNCSFEQFLKLSQLDCYYCGSPPSNKTNKTVKGSSQKQKEEGVFIYNGLDRLDSSQGHTVTNVVPCCCTCNLMKKDMSVDEFLAHIKKISSYLIPTRTLQILHGST